MVKKSERYWFIDLIYWFLCLCHVNERKFEKNYITWNSHETKKKFKGEEVLRGHEGLSVDFLFTLDLFLLINYP